MKKKILKQGFYKFYVFWFDSIDKMSSVWCNRVICEKIWIYTMIRRFFDMFYWFRNNWYYRELFKKSFVLKMMICKICHYSCDIKVHQRNEI